MSQALIEQIKKAFKDHKRPQGKISVETYDDEGTEDYFQGTTWQEHGARELRINVPSLSFLTPEALAYYLPAYMLAEIEDPEEADIIASNLSSTFYYGSYNLDLSLFTKEEKEAVAAFFELCEERYGPERYNPYIGAALAVYDSM